MKALEPEEIIRRLAANPDKTTLEIWEQLRPWRNHASPKEVLAWRDLLAELRPPRHRHPPMTFSDVHGRIVPNKRRRGRPPGTTIIRSPEAVRAACRDVEAGGLRASQERVAEQLGVGVTTLKAYLTEHRMSWPPG